MTARIAALGNAPLDVDGCSTSICDPRAGCVEVVKRDGSACDDGRYCTVGDRCLAGACLGTGRRSCGGDGVTSLSFCDESADSCFVRALDDPLAEPPVADCPDGQRYDEPTASCHTVEPLPLRVAVTQPAVGEVLQLDGESLVTIQVTAGPRSGAPVVASYRLLTAHGDLPLDSRPLTRLDRGPLQDVVSIEAQRVGPDVRSGVLEITAVAGPGEQAQLSVPVRLNRAPRPRFRVAGPQARGEAGATVTLDAGESDDPDGEITRRTWKATVDGEILEAEGASLELFLDDPQEDPIITLIVEDDLRGMAWQTRRLALGPEGPRIYGEEIDAKKDCGCIGMGLFLSGAGTGFFNYGRPFDIPAAFLVPGNPGPLGEHIEPFPAGRGFLAWNWEIVAILDPRTTDMDECIEFQLARGDAFNGRRRVPNPASQRTPRAVPRAVGGVAMPPVVPPGAPYPTFAGAKFGRDNYTRGLLPGGLKLHSPPILVLWSDRPGQHPAPPNQVRSPALDLAEFYSVVSGNLGTCVGHFAQGLLAVGNVGASAHFRFADSTPNFVVLP